MNDQVDDDLKKLISMIEGRINPYSMLAAKRLLANNPAPEAIGEAARCIYDAMTEPGASGSLISMAQARDYVMSHLAPACRHQATALNRPVPEDFNDKKAEPDVDVATLIAIIKVQAKALRQAFNILNNTDYSDSSESEDIGQAYGILTGSVDVASDLCPQLFPPRES